MQSWNAIIHRTKRTKFQRQPIISTSFFNVSPILLVWFAQLKCADVYTALEKKIGKYIKLNMNITNMGVLPLDWYYGIHEKKYFSISFFDNISNFRAFDKSIKYLRQFHSSQSFTRTSKLLVISLSVTGSCTLTGSAQTPQ